MTTRRQFLAASSGLLSGIAFSDSLLRVAPLAADDGNLTPGLVRLTADIEPVVRLIEETPRERCFEVMAEQLQRGLPYRQFLAALYLAGIRNVNPQPPGFKFHCVFVIHAAHQMSLDAQVQDRLLPLFWALDNFKASQQKDIDEGDFKLQPISGDLPSVESAWPEFHAAMREWDEEKADRAITALARSEGANRIIEQLWRYGARDYRNIGHKAIFVANTWRTLQTIGWRHAEPALRSLVLGLLDFGRDEQVNDHTFASQSFVSNSRWVRESGEQLPGDWTRPRADAAPTEEVLAAIRSGSFEDACGLASSLLVKSVAGGPEIWDAVHLAAGELMMQQPGIYGIHTVTSAHALRYAYETSANSQTRLLMLLQGIGWMCQFHGFMKGKPQGLKDVAITQLGPLAESEHGGVSAGEIFALIGKDAPTAASKAAAYAQHNPVPAEFKRMANQLLLHKATDAHDYKYAASIFEDYDHVSPRWRPHMLATATYYLRGTNAPASPVMQRATEVLRGLS